jgi:UDP-4-amino-4,6-dideoxy-N-acetyl-beta-L-altrosamine transaminase
MNNKAKFLPYGRQTIDEDDITAVVETLRSDFLTSGPAIEAFETAVSKETGAKATISCSSGTAALHIAVLALGLGPGDWAIVPTITFLATANAVRYTGADVIFADVDPDNGLMTIETFQAALEANKDKNIRAVLPVHLSGQPICSVEIVKLAHSKGIKIIEDASHALGSSYQEKNSKKMVNVGACAHADMTVFSFHPVKVIACGEGGAVTTCDPELEKRLRLARNHGMTKNSDEFLNTSLSRSSDGSNNPWYYEMIEPGYNYRLSDIHAALGLSQLSKLGQYVAARQRIVALYDQLLNKVNLNVSLLKKISGCSVAWHLYPVLINFDALGVERAQIMDALSKKGVGTQVHYIPVSSQPYYQALYGKQHLAGAEAYYARALSLPLFPTMSDLDVEHVVMSLNEAIKHK